MAHSSKHSGAPRNRVRDIVMVVAAVVFVLGFWFYRREDSAAALVCHDSRLFHPVRLLCILTN